MHDIYWTKARWSESDVGIAGPNHDISWKGDSSLPIKYAFNN